jgi:HSP20 family protein
MALREMAPWKRKKLSRSEEENPFFSLQHEMNRMLERFARSFGGGELAEREEPWRFSPSVDVSENDREIHVSAELPGLSGNNLIIRGEKKVEKEEKGEQFYRKESSYGAFHRSIPLSTEVEEDKIEATYKKGVLKIVLPKSPEARKARKKISIH